MFYLLQTESMPELMGAVGGGRGGRGGRGRKKGGKKALKQDVEVTFGQGGYLCVIKTFSLSGGFKWMW